MTKDQSELRELDAWIAIHLFNMHEFEPHHTNHSLCGVCNHRHGLEMHFMKDWAEISKSLPHYTTDPAAAMEVLKKCAEKCYQQKEFVQILGSPEDGWVVSLKDDSAICIESDAPTIELAICHFAKQLFTQ